MDQLEEFARNYSQTPWRRQIQMIALFSLSVVFVALIAGIYLNLSARSTAVGRDIQNMQREIEELDREVEDKQSQLAEILSWSQMEARARSLGFEPVPSDQIMYLNIPGYSVRQAVNLAPSAERTVVSAVSIPPEYSESLFEWLYREGSRWSKRLFEDEP